jgi:hypothetical protein
LVDGTAPGSLHSGPSEDRVGRGEAGGRHIALYEPVAVYTATTNLEAHFIRNVLVDARLKGHVVEDVSRGDGTPGRMTLTCKPQAFVERADAERARPLLEDYERRQAERQGGES